MTLHLMGSVLSPFVRKARIVLDEKGIDYHLEPVVPFMAPDSFTDLSPLRRVPVLKDSEIDPDWALPDSSAICSYIERKYPMPALYPTAAADYGRALWFEEYADTEFSNIIGQSIFRPALVQVLLGEAPDLELAEKTFQEVLPPYFGYLERSLASQTYFVGDQFSIADISLAVHFQNLRLAGFEIDAAEYPGLAAFIDRLLTRQSFTKCFGEEIAFLEQQGYRSNRSK
ncbi:MAG: glutathione S-transferase family protein [Henriciella sp.]|nr:glutathione S-transferase family protein [Henriciella sp.]